MTDPHDRLLDEDVQPCNAEENIALGKHSQPGEVPDWQALQIHQPNNSANHP